MSKMNKIGCAVAAPFLLIASAAWGEEAIVYPVASQMEIEAAAALCYAATSIVGPVDASKFVAAGWTENAVPASMQSALGNRAFKKGNSNVIIGVVAQGKINGCKVTAGVAPDVNRVSLLQGLDTLYKTPRSGDSTRALSRWVWLLHMARAEFLDFKDFSMMSIFVADFKLN
jgi:hypothetical protein